MSPDVVWHVPVTWPPDAGGLVNRVKPPNWWCRPGCEAPLYVVEEAPRRRSDTGYRTPRRRRGWNLKAHCVTCGALARARIADAFRAAYPREVADALASMRTLAATSREIVDRLEASHAEAVLGVARG